MKTYTICGSMRFAKEMQEIALILEIEYGFNILQCTYNPENVNIDDDQKARLINAHLQKISLSDDIYVVDINGYIGQSVQKEISYAHTFNKEIIYHSNFSNNI